MIVCDTESQLSVRQQTNHNFDIETVLLDAYDKLSDRFNDEFLKEPRANVYGFFLPGDLFVRNDSLATILKKFEPDVGGVYSDKYLLKENNLIPQSYPPYQQDDKFIYNPTPFINGGITKPIFDPNLEHLRFYDVIQKIGSATKVIHIPLFLIKSKLVLANNIDKEIEYVWKAN